jgi:HK97 gp10 family phage protein
MGEGQLREFNSIAAFVQQLATVAIAVKEAEHEMLERAAVMVEKRAKEKIGEYQHQIGPFVAWAELADSTKADRAKQGYAEDEPLLRSGEMRDSIEHVVQGSEACIGSNSDIAVYQELGTEHMPPRSFLGGAMAEKVPEILKMTGKTFVAALVGEKVFQGLLPIKE